MLLLEIPSIFTTVIDKDIQKKFPLLLTEKIVKTIFWSYRINWNPITTQVLNLSLLLESMSLN